MANHGESSHVTCIGFINTSFFVCLARIYKPLRLVIWVRGWRHVGSKFYHGALHNDRVSIKQCSSNHSFVIPSQISIGVNASLSPHKLASGTPWRRQVDCFCIVSEKKCHVDLQVRSIPKSRWCKMCSICKRRQTPITDVVAWDLLTPCTRSSSESFILAEFGFSPCKIGSDVSYNGHGSLKNHPNREKRQEMQLFPCVSRHSLLRDFCKCREPQSSFQDVRVEGILLRRWSTLFAVSQAKSHGQATIISTIFKTENTRTAWI